MPKGEITMKKSFILLCALPLLLTSCGGGESNFYGKSYSYKGGCCYDLENASPSTSGEKSMKDYMEDAFRNNNVDLSMCGGYDGLYVIPFEKCGNYGEMISSMETMAKNSFDHAYEGGLSFTVGSKEDKTFTLKMGNETYNWSFSEYESQETYLNIKNGERTVGHITSAPLIGYGWVNGNCQCVEFELDGVTSRVQFVFGFKNPVSIDGQEYMGLRWYTYAKIN